MNKETFESKWEEIEMRILSSLDDLKELATAPMESVKPEETVQDVMENFDKVLAIDVDFRNYILSPFRGKGSTIREPIRSKLAKRAYELKQEGLKNTDIGKLLGCGAGTISRLMKEYILSCVTKANISPKKYADVHKGKGVR